MTTKDEALKLAQDLRTLADRFSEGWHDGIKIDASEIMLLTDAAATLASEAKEQPAPATELREQEFVAHCEGGPEFCSVCHKELNPSPAIYPEEAYEMGLEEIAYYTSPPAQQEPVERGGLRFYTNGVERQHWKADGSIDFKDKQGNVTMTIAAGSITSPQPSKPLTDEQMFEMVEIAWRHGWASCRDAEYVGEEAEDERWGMVGAEVVQDISALGIKENT